MANKKFTVAAYKAATVAQSDRVTVADSSANIQANLNSLLSDTKVDFIDSTQNGRQLTLTAAQATAANLAKLNAFDRIVVSDTVANVQAVLPRLLAQVKIDGITLTDDSASNALKLRVAQTTAQNMLKLSVGDTIQVADNSANINSKLVKLLDDRKIDSIDSTNNAAAINLPVRATNASRVSKLSEDDNVVVTLPLANGLGEAKVGVLNTSSKIDKVVNAPSLTVSATTVDEGKSVSFSIINGKANTQYSYNVTGTGIDGKDLVAGTDAVFTTDAAGKATVELAVSADQATEGTETMNIKVLGLGITGNVGINDTSKDANNIGTDGDDNLLGTIAAETIAGGNGNDTINGAGGLDTLTGGNGNDRMTFIGSESAIQGGADVDTLVIPDFNSALSAFDFSGNSSQAFRTLIGAPALTTTNIVGFENLDASASDLDLVIDSATGNFSIDDTSFGDGANTTSIITGSGNDRIHVGNHTAALTVSTGAGNDTVRNSSAVGVTLIGGAGNDNLSGGAGNDSLDGGLNNDTVNAGAGVDTVNLGDGSDTATFGTAGANFLTAADTLVGGAGTDTLAAGAGNFAADPTSVNVSGIDAVTVDTTAGGRLVTLNNAFVGSSDADTVTVNAAAASDNLITISAAVSAANTVVLGVTDIDAYALANAVNNRVTLGDVADTTNTGNGIADETGLRVLDGTGNDTITGSGAKDFISLDFSGNNVVTAGAGADTVIVGKGQDNINLGEGDDTVAFVFGNNVGILDAADTLVGGTGTDTLAAGSSDFTAVANTLGVSGIDAVTVDTTADRRTVTLNDDFVDASDANTVTINAASASNNAIIVSAAVSVGNTVVLGVTDIDAYFLANGVNNRVTLGDVADTTNLGNGIADETGITVFDGTGGNDSITGSGAQDMIILDSGNNVVTGGAGADTVGAGGGVDNIDLGEGDDTLFVDPAVLTAADTIVGGAGTDTLAAGANNFTAGPTSVNVKGIDAVTVNTNDFDRTVSLDDTFVAASDAKTVTINAAGKSDKFIIVNAAVSEGNTVILGTTDIDAYKLLDGVNNRVTLGNVADTTNLGNGIADETGITVLDGKGNGNDTITGSGAKDTITLDSGKNVVTGGAGADTVNAGTGDDKIDLGDGNDTVSFSGKGINFLTAADTIVGGAGTDTLAVGANSFTAGDNIKGVRGIDAVTVITNIERTVTLNDAFVGASDNDTVTIDAAGESFRTIFVSAAVLAGNTVVLGVTDPNAYALADGVNNRVTLGDVADTTNTGNGIADETGLTVTLGTGNDTITGSGAKDTFIINAANLTIDDAIDGAGGVDTLIINSSTGTLSDGLFSSLTSVETLNLRGLGGNQNLTLGPIADAAGINTVTFAQSPNNALNLNASAMTTGLTVTLTSAVNNNDSIVGGKANDTINISNDSSNAAQNTVAGGAGSDAITLGLGTDTVRINLFTDLTAGSTSLSGADIITGFSTVSDKLDLGNTILTTTGGAPINLSFDGAADDLGSVIVTRFANDVTVANVANLTAPANQSAFVFEVNADVVNDPGNTLLNQAGINEAISFISANIGKTTIANASVLLTVEDGANTAIFQYQEGALDAGIQASELTLIGVLSGVTDIAAGDLI